MVEWLQYLCVTNALFFFDCYTIFSYSLSFQQKNDTQMNTHAHKHYCVALWGKKAETAKKTKKTVNEAQFGVKTRHTKPTHITYPGPAG